MYKLDFQKVSIVGALLLALLAPIQQTLGDLARSLDDLDLLKKRSRRKMPCGHNWHRMARSPIGKVNYTM